MRIRPAEERDIPRLLALLSQILELHAALRPDLFVSGSVKYTEAELRPMLSDPEAPVFVAVDENDGPVGYAFCRIREPSFANTMKPLKTFFIDDLCVDESCRGQGIGEALYRFAAEEGKRRGCAFLTLDVWAGNEGARRFYEKMGMRPRETRMEFEL